MVGGLSRVVTLRRKTRVYEGRRRGGSEVEVEDERNQRHVISSLSPISTSHPLLYILLSLPSSRLLPHLSLLCCIPSFASVYSRPTAIMDVVAAVSGYITKMVTAGDSSSSSSKMKILLLDSETVRYALLVAGLVANVLLGSHRVDGDHPVRPAQPRSVSD